MRASWCSEVMDQNAKNALDVTAVITAYRRMNPGGDEPSRTDIEHAYMRGALWTGQEFYDPELKEIEGALDSYEAACEIEEDVVPHPATQFAWICGALAEALCRVPLVDPETGRRKRVR